MQIVIDIPDNYNLSKIQNGSIASKMILNAVANGVPLRPKAIWKVSNIPGEKYICSNCGGACWYYGYQGEVAKSNYCPNCGAKMENGGEA